MKCRKDMIYYELFNAYELLHFDKSLKHVYRMKGKEINNKYRHATGYIDIVTKKKSDA